MARYNRAVVLDLIRRHGPVSKNELAGRSGLAASSVLNVVSSLSRRGLLRIVGRGPSTGGRPPVLLELNPDAHYAVGVTIRIAGVEAVLLDLLGDIRAETLLPLQGALGVEHVTDTIVEAVDQVVRLARIEAGKVLAAGVGCPGPITGGRVVLGAPSLPDWKNVPLAETLERRLGLPVVLENDANVGALAEYRHGVGKWSAACDPLVYIYADHGVGAGIVIDGKLYRGFDGLAGELGHSVIDVDGPPCVCGSYGCLEVLASVPAVVRRVHTAARSGRSTIVDPALDDATSSTLFALVGEAVGLGDALATAALEEAVGYLAVGVSNVMRQFRPQVIVVGGQMFEGVPGTYERLLSAVARRSGLFGAPNTRIEMGQVGPHAASVGAATLVLENFFGVAQQVISSEPLADVPEPAFEYSLVWPRQAEAGILLAPSKTKVKWARNLRPILARVRAGEQVQVSLDVKVDEKEPDNGASLKVVLHWDRVTLFGGSWPNPKNSPMQCTGRHGATLTYGLVLGMLPPGKYEFSAHVLGASDLWVRADAPGEPNGRLEILPSRAFAARLVASEPELFEGEQPGLTPRLSGSHSSASRSTDGVRV
jgi:predicted NBD/HSP70 family sugar kinase